MTVKIKSYNQILGSMVNKLITDTNLSDMRIGSVISMIMEAASQSDFEIYASLVQLLQLASIDTTTGGDLDRRASEFNLTRYTPQKATGFITVTDSSFTKRNTKLYIGLPAPIVGDRVLNIEDAVHFDATGSLYIGRGTSTFEGPIPYTTVTPVPPVSPTYWSITLSSPLTKNHAPTEIVVQSKGGNRVISAGSVVGSLASNLSPAVDFTVDRDTTLIDGEDTIENVPITAVIAGSTSNVSAGSITRFGSLPFTGAKVTNPSSIVNGRDVEQDADLRIRIKNVLQVLAKGTESAILGAVNGVSDPTDNKTVLSSSITEPTTAGQPSQLYIDDGTGFEPTFAGQGTEVVVSQAAGSERFLQLSHFPVTPPMILSSQDEPYALFGGQVLSIRVNEEVETITFDASDFSAPGQVRLDEVINAINAKSNLVTARSVLSRTRFAIVARRVNGFDPDEMQVLDDDARVALALSDRVARTLSLYKNDTLLKRDAISAVVYTLVRSAWNFGTNTSVKLIIKVDGTPAQGSGGFISIDNTDFASYGVGFANATLAQWAAVLNSKIAGATAVVELSQLHISSNKTDSASASVEIVNDGASDNLATLIFSGAQYSVGSASDYAFSRFSGQVELASRLNSGDNIVAGTQYTRSRVESAVVAGGRFNFPIGTDGTKPVLYVSANSTCLLVTVTQSVGTTYTISWSSAQEIQLQTDKTNGLVNIKVDDYVLITPKTVGWFSANTDLMGLFRVTSFVDAETIKLGAATTSFAPVSAVTTGLYDVQAFSCDGLVQSIDLTGQNLLAQDVISKINASLAYVIASAKSANQVRIESISFDDTVSAISVLASTGSAIGAFIPTIASSASPAHIGSELASVGQMTFPALSASVPGLLSQKYARGIVNGSLTSNSSSPNPQVIDSTQTFTSTITESDTVVMLSGLNSNYFTPVRSINSNTVLNVADFHSRNFHVADRYAISRSHKFGAADKIVVVLDGDDNNKTFNIPLYRTGRVSNTPPATTGAFSAYDADSASSTTFDAITWNDFNFADFDLMFRARNIYKPNNNASGSMVIRSVMYGDLGESTSFSVQYPRVPVAAASISHTVSSTETAVAVTLPSGIGRINISSVGAGFFLSKSSNQVTLDYAGVGTAPNFSGNGVLAGDIVNLSDVGFIAKDSAFNDVGRVTSVSSTTLVLSVLSSGTISYAKTLTQVASVSSSITRYYTADTSRLTVGDYIAISGFTKTANNLSNVVIYAINPGVSVDVTGSNRVSVSNPGPLPISSASRTSSVVSLVFAVPVGTTIESGDAIDVSNMAPIALTAIEGAGLVVTSVVGNTVTYTLAGPDISSTPVTSGYGTIVTAKNQTAAGSLNVIFKQLNLAGIQAFPVGAFTANNLKTLVQGSTLAKKVVSVVIAAGQSGNSSITRATYDEATSVGYGHTIGQDRVWLYDGEFNVSSFVSIIGNTSHNFTLKSPISFSHPDYDITTAPNQDTTDVGELFKLTPVTFRNTSSLLMKNAITAFSIFGRADATAEGGRLQLSSLQIGSSGSVNVTGGYGNAFRNILKSQAIIDGSTLRVEISTSEAETIRVGQVVKLTNSVTSQKPRGFTTNDKFDIKAETTATALLVALPRAISLTIGDSLAITDVSNLYGRTIGSGIVWRWTGPSGAWFGAKVGDSLFARNTAISLNQTLDPSTNNGEYKFPTFLVVGTGSDYIDVHNPSGQAESVASLASPLNMYVTPSFSTSYTTAATIGTQLRVESLLYANLVKITWIGGVAPKFASNGVTIDSYVIIGTAFNVYNRGTFRVVAVGEDHVVFANNAAVPEVVTFASIYDLRFLDSESTIIGDTISISDAPFLVANRGTLPVLSVGFLQVIHGVTPTWLNYARLAVNNAVDQESVALTGLPRTFFVSDGVVYSTYREVTHIAQSPINIDSAFVYLSTNQNDHKIGDIFGTVMVPITKFGFTEDIAAAGLDGYRYFTGLLSTVQKVVDGYDQDTTTYPGYKAAGVQVEVLPPLIKRVQLSVIVKPSSGISLSALSDAIISTILNYLNTLGVGQDIILSEVVSRAMQVEGVESVQMSSPPATQERIIVEDQQKVIATIDNITITSA